MKMKKKKKKKVKMPRLVFKMEFFLFPQTGCTLESPEEL